MSSLTPPYPIQVPLNQWKDNKSFIFLIHFTSLSPIKELDLSHNQISGIEETIASRLLNIANVRLDNNPLICDKCHLGPLIGKVKLVSGATISLSPRFHLIPFRCFPALLCYSNVCCGTRNILLPPEQTKWTPQLKWKLPPICFFPDQIRGTAVNELREQDIDNCVEIIENEDLDAASTSYNFLESGEWRGGLDSFLYLSLPLFIYDQFVVWPIHYWTGWIVDCLSSYLTTLLSTFCPCRQSECPGHLYWNSCRSSARAANRIHSRALQPRQQQCKTTR